MNNSIYFRTLLSLAIGAGFSIATIAAQAATRTVCYKVEIRDERTGCPTVGTVGAKRACDPAGNYSEFIGGIIELWDKDSDGNDEQIGSWTIAGPGTRCATFEWENASYSKGEEHPDVYLKVRREVKSTTGTGPKVRAVDASGNPYNKITWRNEGSNFLANNCGTSGNCYISSTHVPSTSTTSVMSQSFAMIDSAQRVLEIYHADMDSSTINAWYPVVNNPNGNSCATGLAWSRTDFCLPDGLGTDADRVTHEMGHVLQMQMFNQDGLRDVILGGSWNMGTSSFETESGATTEGWAAYVGAVAWYEPNNASTVPFYSGVNIDDATLSQATCNNNITLPRQAAKAFWDLDDANNEAGTRAGVADNDTSSQTTTWMARQWDEFTNGTGNRDDFENDNNGVNVRDYLFRAGNTHSETLLAHNCLTGQDDN